MRAAHAAEVSDFGSRIWECLVVKFPRRIGVERQVELVFPPKLESRFRQGVISEPSARMSFGQVRRMGRDLIRNNAIFHIFLVRQAQMLLWGDITEHCGAV